MAESSPFIFKLSSEALVKVLEFLDYNSLQSFRKTCHHARNVLSTTPVKLNHSTIMIFFSPKGIEITWSSKWNGCYVVNFSQKDNDCLVKFRGERNLGSGFLDILAEKRKLLIDASMVDVAFYEYKCLLKHQKGEIRRFSIRHKFDGQQSISASLPTLLKFRDNLMDYMASRKMKLQMQDFDAYVLDESYVMAFLPYVKPTKHNIFQLKMPAGQKINKIVGTTTWKKIETFRTEVTIDTSLVNFFHFRHARMALRTMSLSELIQFKNVLCEDPTIPKVCISIECTNFDREGDNKFTQLGHPVKMNGSARTWHFDTALPSVRLQLYHCDNLYSFTSPDSFKKRDRTF